jgi:hypothetical protein
MRTGTAQKFNQFYAMKKVHKSLFWAIVSLFALSSPAVGNAQDDLYYDPATDAPAPRPAVYTEEYNDNNNVTRTYNDNDEYYDDDDDYGYEYSSRIRRFQRRSPVVDYYDPYFVDLYNYDPFFSPGTSIYVYNYNDYWSYRRWQRYNRWNRFDYGWGGGGWAGGWGGGWNSWGWSSPYTFNQPWYNPWVVNNYYYDPYWTCNGYNPYYQNQYWGNGWTNNHYYYNNNTNHGNGGGDGYAPKTYTGPRRNGSSVNPGYARIPDSKGRLATSETNVPLLEKAPARTTRTVGDYDGNTAVGRGKTADRSTDPGTTRRPDGSTATPEGRTRTEAPTTRGTETPTGRGGQTPATRTEEGYKPRRTEESPVRPPRTETPTRRNDNEGGSATPRRSDPAPTRTEESRPVRRTEERSYERPTRSNNNGGGGSTQESRPTRSSSEGSSTRSSSGGSTRSESGGSTRSSSGGGNSSSKSSGGRGGRG